MRTTIQLVPATEALQAFPELIGNLVSDQLPKRYTTDAAHVHEVAIEVRRLEAEPTTTGKRGPGRPRNKPTSPKKGPGRPRKSAAK